MIEIKHKFCILVYTQKNSHQEFEESTEHWVYALNAEQAITKVKDLGLVPEGKQIIVAKSYDEVVSKG